MKNLPLIGAALIGGALLVCTCSDDPAAPGAPDAPLVVPDPAPAATARDRAAGAVIPQPKRPPPAASARSTAPSALPDAGSEPSTFVPTCADVDAGSPCDPECTEPGRYQVDPLGIVEDSTLGLWFTRDVYGPMSHDDADAYCASLSLLGVVDHWRLADASELAWTAPGGAPHAPFTCPGACSPRVDQAAFPGTPVGLFWGSSMVMLDNPDGGPPIVAGQILDTCSGAIGREDPSALAYVRCVREPM